MKRRQLIQSAGGGALGLLGAGLPLVGHAQDRFAKYKGQTVVMSIPAHPHYDAMLKLLPEFTKQTGIKVETDRLAVPRMKDKQLLEMAKPTGDYDLICYVVMWKGEYVKKNLIRELDPYFKNTALADPDYDFKDVVPRYVENMGLVGGSKGYLAGPGAKLYGMPFGEPNLEILMRHRAVLFGLLGAFLIAAAFMPALQTAAFIAGFASVVSFLWLAWSVGGYNPQISRVVVADVVALVCLVIGGVVLVVRMQGN